MQQMSFAPDDQSAQRRRAAAAEPFPRPDSGGFGHISKGAAVACGADAANADPCANTGANADSETT
jgi:hypothetical protein